MDKALLRNIPKVDELLAPTHALCPDASAAAVECPIPPTCPECQPWLRECHNVAFLGIGK